MFGLETTVVQQSTDLDIPGLLSSVVWVDWTALIIVGIFFILGLVRGFIWQASRILSLVAGFVLAGMYGQSGASLLQRWQGGGGSANGLTLYLSYVFIFLAVVAVLSLVAYFVQKLVKKSGFGFYDRICGGFMGVATGACLRLHGSS